MALARAIVNKPLLLLLDEPLSALDLKLRKQVQIELKHIQAKLGIAFVFVTHDQEEALTMADRVVVMNNGRIEQIGTGAEIYRAPATRFVADFIGDANLIACSPRADGRLQPELGSLSLDRGDLPSRTRATAVLRPEDVYLLQAPETAGFSTVQAIVEDVIGVGSYTLVNMRANGTSLSCRISGDLPIALRAGSPVTAGYRPERLHLIADLGS